MTPDSEDSARWSELASLVDRLLDAAPEHRDAIVEALSAGDPVRRAELEALRAECEREPALLSIPAAERFAALFDDEAHFPDALAERYSLTRELGRGGMATVYLARDVKHGRDVAVKVVHPAIAAALGADRFLREIEIVAQLHHPHIVPLYDSGDADGALYYVMPFEPGLSLRQRLASEGPLPVDDVIVILRDVCDALAHAHARGIVHRDIKPDNVLLSGRHAMIADFGVAKSASESTLRATGVGPASPRTPADTVAGVALGTPAYMAPEQIAADPHIDHRADIYAVGVLGYELLAGHPPFAGGTRDEVLSAHLTDAPAPVASHRPEVPAPLAELVMRCLAKRPADRWQSADELLQRLAPLAVPPSQPAPRAPSRRWMRTVAMVAGVVVLLAAAVFAWRGSRPDLSWRTRWAKARIEKLTDFAGSEVDAAISADGRLVTFLSDRDSVFDAFVSQVGSGRFVNLTNGRLDQLFNEDVRNVGFAHDASHVWLRVAALTSPASVSLLPATGGALTPFLQTAVMAVWSPDGTRLAYHETTPGDPIYLADSDGARARRIYIAAPGLHSHYLTWSPDGRYIYFSHGLPPNEMDIWRIAATGGQPERITSHDSRVGYPVMVDDRTLLYTATDDDGAGPWLYSMDLDDRVATRLSSGVEHFVSIAASAERAGQPRRLVATVSNPSVQLWSVPLGGGIAGEERASRLSLPTARSAAPRFAPDSSLLYLASRGGADGLWRLSSGGATELWRADDGAVAGAAAISPDGWRVCFTVRRRARSTLRCTLADGSGVRTLADSLDVRGAPSWSPDGRWLAIGAREGPSIRVFKLPAEGGPPVRLVDSVSSNPVWSPDGKFILYSGTTRGRSVPLKAVTPNGAPFALPTPSLLVDRLGDSYRFLPDGKGLVVKLGGFRRQDFWWFDVATGARRQLTRLRPGESVSRFDVSPDGMRLVFERVRENSDIVLIELPSQ
ncbi:MAG: protein kinase [Gemmatimonadetes bacterium]|nr:protein kinase [Gemmatimonadota bacterium]